MKKDYLPTDWYWIVAGDTTKVFSSSRADYVPATDTTYTAWTADGTIPTQIDSEANLGSVLATVLMRPIPAGILDGYKTAQANEIASGPAFKPVFYLMQQVAALNGDPHPTVDEAISYTKSVL